MSAVYECQECKKLQSALSENGNCIECEMKARQFKMRDANIKVKLIECDGDVRLVAKLTGEKPEYIEEVKSKMEIRLFETVYYSCTACGRKTDVIVSRMGRSGICQTCADRLERGYNLKEREDHYKEPINHFSATDVTPRHEEVKPRVKSGKNKK